MSAPSLTQATNSSDTSLVVKLKENWKSGITVALVSFPMSISLAIAAGATPIMGITTAVFAGFFAAVFGGSHFNVVGPTGALSGLLLGIATTYGASMLPLFSVIVGIMIFGIWAFRLDKYIVFVSGSVLHGFTLGVAFIIGLNQLNFALGLSGMPNHEKFLANVWESIRHVAQMDFATLLLTVFGLLFLLILSKRAPKIPWVIILALFGIGVGYASSKGIFATGLHTLATQYGTLSGSLVTIPTFSLSMLHTTALMSAAAVAFVAVLETLISTKIADTATKVTSDQRKEVFGLSLANIASGVCGGIPATAALARTALNIKSGASHKASSVINSIALILITVVFLSSFRFLPLATVASILIYIAVRMVWHEHFIHLYTHDRVAFWISMFVAAVTVTEDPMMGILVGTTITLLFTVKKISESQAEFTVLKSADASAHHRTQDIHETEQHGDMLIYRVAGQLLYMNGHAHIKNIEQIGDSIHTVIIGLRNMFYIDIDGIDALGSMVETLRAKNKYCIITGVNTVVEPLLSQSAWYKTMRDSGHVFSSTPEAITHVRSNRRSA